MKDSQNNHVAKEIVDNNATVASIAKKLGTDKKEIYSWVASYANKMKRMSERAPASFTAAFIHYLWQTTWGRATAITIGAASLAIFLDQQVLMLGLTSSLIKQGRGYLITEISPTNIRKFALTNDKPVIKDVLERANENIYFVGLTDNIEMKRFCTEFVDAIDRNVRVNIFLYLPHLEREVDASKYRRVMAEYRPLDTEISSIWEHQSQNLVCSVDHVDQSKFTKRFYNQTPEGWLLARDVDFAEYSAAEIYWFPYVTKAANNDRPGMRIKSGSQLARTLIIWMGEIELDSTLATDQLISTWRKQLSTREVIESNGRQDDAGPNSIVTNADISQLASNHSTNQEVSPIAQNGPVQTEVNENGVEESWPKPVAYLESVANTDKGSFFRNWEAVAIVVHTDSVDIIDLGVIRRDNTEVYNVRLGEYGDYVFFADRDREFGEFKRIAERKLRNVREGSRFVNRIKEKIRAWLPSNDRLVEGSLTPEFACGDRADVGIAFRVGS